MLKYLTDRLKEGSTWASLGVLAMGVSSLSPELWTHVTAAGVGIFALIGFLIKDKPSE